MNREKLMKLGMEKLASNEYDLTDKEWLELDNENVAGPMASGLGIGGLAGFFGGANMIPENSSDLAHLGAGLGGAVIGGGLGMTIGSHMGDTTSGHKINRLQRKARTGNENAQQKIDDIRKKLEKTAQEIPGYWQEKMKTNPEVKELIQKRKELLENAPEDTLTPEGRDWQNRTNISRPASIAGVSGGLLGAGAGGVLSGGNPIAATGGALGGVVLGSHLGASYGSAKSPKKTKKILEKAKAGDKSARRRIQKSNKLGGYEPLRKRLQEIMREDWQ